MSVNEGGGANSQLILLSGNKNLQWSTQCK